MRGWLPLLRWLLPPAPASVRRARSRYTSQVCERLIPVEWRTFNGAVAGNAECGSRIPTREPHSVNRAEHGAATYAHRRQNL
ncbi:hypothetical protein GCM10010289_77510 [Streptomyces violascens]|uniref:Secreted protein n=1 Tax=Streptomyces violascens TaxID=67381 RepID=A0ABQ3QKX6_9ACTN|nr:hypothetical protein GCM10010289_77510 [Streptomyces violascens]GHI37923.1 hypothetical protein Sviol_23310 [Streptomyces violascens]